MDYRVDVKVRNNVFLYKLEKAGYKTLGELCRLNNKMNHVGILGEIINMTTSPFQADGKWRKQILWASEILNCAPEDLFNEAQLNTVLKTNKKQMQINEAELKFLITQNESKNISLEDMTEKEQFNKALDETLKTLLPREKKVLDMRFGIGDYSESHTLEQISQEFGVNRERIRQIEQKALRKLRHPSRYENLKEFYHNAD